MEKISTSPAEPARADQPRSGAAHRAASPEPVTERGRRTRAALVEAARRVFAEHGYHDATIGDITAEADVAHGTFYTYFESKRDLFQQVMAALVADFRNEAHAVPRTGDDPRSRVERANRGYLRAYQRNARLMGVLEQVAIADPELRDIRLASRHFWVQRAEERMKQWQAAGLTRPDVDVQYAANLLGAMVDRCAFLWFVLGEPYDEDRAVASISDLYANALGLPGPAQASPGQASTPDPTGA
jgi:AcrR family transcriptional regulator